MADSVAPQSRAITLDELMALNDEIAALVRAGVPLEKGLAHLARDLPGRLAKLADQLAARMDRGQPLVEILADPSIAVPPLYRVVVEAGIRSGRLAQALESLARSTRCLSECRRMVFGAAVYPLLLFLIAWGSFVWFVLRVAPPLADSMRSLGAFGRGFFATVAGWGDTAWYWGPAVPAVVLLLAGTWWYGSARAALVQPRSAGWLLGWLPWLGGMFRSLRVASFAEILAMLVENQIPLDQAVTLAAASTADLRMIQAARRLAEAIRQGESLHDMPAWTGPTLPPLARWLMAAGHERGVLLKALRNTAEIYRRRAIGQAEFARLYLPAALTVLVGGGLALVHSLMVFAPWVSVMQALMRIH